MLAQDEEYAGFGGPHCMVVGGYSQITDALAAGLDVRLGCAASSISYDDTGVRVTCASGEVVEGKAAVVTVPLGCLKAADVTFQPALPSWKQDAVEKLGFGALNKVRACCSMWPEGGSPPHAEWSLRAVQQAGHHRCCMQLTLSAHRSPRLLQASAEQFSPGDMLLACRPRHNLVSV